MSDNHSTIHDRLEDILNSIELIQEWSNGRTSVNDFMMSSTGVMAFNACVMRFQVIGILNINTMIDQIIQYNKTFVSVRNTVETISTHPLVPKDIVVRGFIIDSETGALEEVL